MLLKAAALYGLMMKVLALVAVVWLLTPGNEHWAFHDIAVSICEVTSGDDAWGCDQRFGKEGSRWAKGAPEWAVRMPWEARGDRYAPPLLQSQQVGLAALTVLPVRLDRLPD